MAKWIITISLSHLIPFSVCLLLSFRISQDLESILLYSFSAWLFAGAALVCAGHPDSGVGLALVGPVFGLLIFLPFLVPVNDPAPLVLVWIVWLAVSATSIQLRRTLKSFLWENPISAKAMTGRIAINTEVMGASVMFLVVVVVLFGYDTFLSLGSILLAVLLLSTTWFLLPLTQESRYRLAEGSQETERDTSIIKDERAQRWQGRLGLARAVLSTGFFFLAGLFLPMVFAVGSDTPSYYVVGGIVFLDAAILRATGTSAAAG